MLGAGRRFSRHPPPGSLRPSTSVIYSNLLSFCSVCDLGEIVVDLPASDLVQDAMRPARAFHGSRSVPRPPWRCVLPLSRATGGPVAVLARPRATVVAAQTNDAVRAERRRRCVHPAPNMQCSIPGFAMRLGSTSVRRCGCTGRSYPSHSNMLAHVCVA